MKEQKQVPVPRDAFMYLLPVEARYIAPGEWKIVSSQGSDLFYVEGSALAEWLRDRINEAANPAESGKGSRSRSKKQKIEDALRQSDLTAQVAERDDIEYGHHESLPRGEHVANVRKPANRER